MQRQKENAFKLETAFQLNFNIQIELKQQL